MVLALVALSLIAALSTVLTALIIFPDGTPDLDEVAYQSQANALSDGHMRLSAATHDPFFRPFLSGLRDDHVVFKYQPVWPALISVSDRMFGSTLPLRVLLSIGGVLAVAWFAWELLREKRVAVIAAALVVASPLAWLQTASILGYQLSFVLGTAAAAALLRALRTRTTLAAVGAGGLFGLAAFHRPFDAVLAIAPVLVYTAWRARQERTLGRIAGAFVVGGLPFAILLLAYNDAVMGSVLRLPFGVTGRVDSFGFGWRASFALPGTDHTGQIDYTIGRAFATARHAIAVLPRFTAFAPVVLVGLGIAAWRYRRDTRMWLLVAMIATVLVGYLFWWGTANAFHFELERSLGPFYHYPLLVPLFVAAAWGLMALRGWLRTLVVLLLVGIVWTGVASLIVLRDARDAGRTRTRELRTLAVGGRSLVLDSPLFPGDPYLRVASAANLRAEHLVALDVPSRRLELLARFADRPAYLVRRLRAFGDVFGTAHTDQVRLTLTRAPQITARMRATLPPGRAGTAYLRIGGTEPALSTSGTGSIDASWLLTPEMLGPPGHEKTVAVGVTLGRPGGPAPTAMTGEWYECRFQARATASGAVEALTPCDGWTHYEFPNGTTATSNEDLAGHISLVLKGSDG